MTAIERENKNDKANVAKCFHLRNLGEGYTEFFFLLLSSKPVHQVRVRGLHHSWSPFHVLLTVWTQLSYPELIFTPHSPDHEG
jgi:hypothetical protein